MIHVLGKELNYYFKSLFGYFFGAVLLVFAGIYTVMVNCNMGYASFEYTLNNMSFIYLIMIPILTMRSFAEERRQRTDQLLYSLPLSMTKIVAGKYLALLVTLAVPIAIMALYPLLLSRYGEVSLRMAYVTLLAYFMLGAALAAVGLFLSTLTENQAISAALCFAVLLFTYFGSNLTKYIPGSAFASFLALAAVVLVIAAILFLQTRNIWTALGVFSIGIIVLELVYTHNKRSFEGLFADLVGYLSVFERFYAFVRGVFDLRSLVYFLSLIVLFLYLSVQSLEKRRWS